MEQIDLSRPKWTEMDVSEPKWTEIDQTTMLM